MWKTRIKISKILTNIHAGFVTALLGCVLTFAPLNAMAIITFTPGTCTRIGSTYSGTYTDLDTGMYTCRSSEYIYFRTSSGGVYRKSSCVCSSDQTPVYALLSDVRSLCGGTAELKYVERCTSGSDTDCTPTPIIPMPGQTYTPVNTVQNCAATEYLRVNGSVYASCTSCSGSTSMQTESIPVSGCDDYEFSTCPCTQSYQCPTPPVTTLGGIRRTFVKSCNTVTGACGSSLSTCSCAKNYYGTVSKSGQTCSGTCTKCATDPKTGLAGVTDSYGNGTASERCYIPSGEAFTDEKGSGRYSGACYDL